MKRCFSASGILFLLVALNFAIGAEPAIVDEIKFEGKLLANKESVIRSRISGKVVKISVSEGDSVKKGQILGELDGEKAQQDLQLAEAEKEKRKLEYEKALAELEKIKKSAERRSASDEDVKNAERGLKIAELVLKEAEITAEKAQKDLESVILRSSIDGTVTLISRKVGDKVFPDDELLRIVDLYELSLVGTLESVYYGKIKTGMEIIFNADYLKDTFKTRVDKIVPFSETGKEFKIYGAVQNVSLKLLPGTKVNCIIRLR